MSTARSWTAAAVTLMSAALVALAAPGAASADTASCANGALTPVLGATAPVQQAVVCLIDQQRAAAGLPALAEQPLLDQAAGAYAQRMVAEDFFAHVSPDGSTLASRLTSAGYAFDAAGEDIGYATGTDATAAAMVAAWMASPEHRANILEPSFTDIGVGAVPGVPIAGATAGATYVADFGHASLPASSGSAATVASAPASAAPRAPRAARRCTRRRAHRHLCRLPRRHRSRA